VNTSAQRRGAVWSLAIAETLVWAGTFYLFPALLKSWEVSLGWSKTSLTGVFSAALIMSAVCSPIAGRLVDMGYGRIMLSASCAVAALALVALSATQTWIIFVGLWLVIGVCMAGSLYDACFAFVVRTSGDSARQVITLITLFAGFAGTLSFPLNTAIAEAFEWQASVLTFAALLAFVAAPLFWWGGGTFANMQAGLLAGAQAPASCGVPIRSALKSQAFWLLSISFAMLYLSHITLITHLLPLLEERGVSLADAVLTVSLLGPSQVLGRIIMVSMGKRVSVASFALASLGLTVVAALILVWAPSVLSALIAFAILQGMGVGMSSITRPLITAQLLGRANFGVIAGMIATVVLLTTAFAPISSSFVWSAGGYDLVAQLNIIVAVISVVSMSAALTGRRQP
jgi:MFS family permease